MNHLLKTTDIFKIKSKSEVITNIKSNIHLISVDTDYFLRQTKLKPLFRKSKLQKQCILSRNQIHSRTRCFLDRI